MPTIACPDCERQVSPAAAACPNCGRPMAVAAQPATPANSVHATAAGVSQGVRNEKAREAFGTMALIGGCVIGLAIGGTAGWIVFGIGFAGALLIYFG